MPSRRQLDRINDTFCDAIITTLCQKPLPHRDGPLLKPTLLGRGGNGFVLRGYVPVRAGGERVRWLVVKGPLLIERPDGIEIDGPDSSRLVVHHVGVEYECEARRSIGDVPGLGTLPEDVALPTKFVEDALPASFKLLVDLPRPAITLLVFELFHQDVVDAPPTDLGRLVEGPVATATDLINWCEIARSLGYVLRELHHRGWVHRDIKLANVVAQRDRGLLRSVEVIDLGAADYFAAHAPLGNRVYATGAGTKQYWRPARLAVWRANGRPVQESAVDEDVYAYASLLARVLLGRLPAKRPRDASGSDAGLVDPDRPWAEEIEALVAQAQSSHSEPVDPIARETARAFALVDALLVTEHRSSQEPLTQFLLAVERIRNEAFLATVNPRVHSTTGLGRIPEMLASLDGHAFPDQKKRWCERYASVDEEVALRVSCVRPGTPLSVDVAVNLLRHGYVTIARHVLDELLQGPRGVDHDAEDARGLRIYVGQILLREGSDATAREVLARYGAGNGPGAPPDGLTWWIKMLTARLDFRERKDALRQPAPAFPESLKLHRVEGREAVWLCAFKVQWALRHKTGVSAAVRAELAALRHSTHVSTSELIFVSVLLAHSLAKAGELVEALRCLQLGAFQASERDFPVEYATILVYAAEVLLLFEDRPRLEREGVDVDALLDTAMDLAIHGADLLHQMKVDVERDRAILVAGRCAAARAGQRGVLAAACWHELADANAVLSGRPSRVRRPVLQTLRDPGTSGAQRRYEHHGAALEKLWGLSGMIVELTDEAGEIRPGAALDVLLCEPMLNPPPSNILVIGCGTGGDCFRLAERYPGAAVHGVDAFAWNIVAATNAASGSPSAARCTFRCVNLVQGEALGGEGLGGKGPWDLVVMRDTLADVTLKRSFLHVLRQRLQPGARLRISNVVQRQACGPLAWRSLLHRLGVPNLTSQQALRADLEAANFVVHRDELDDSRAMVDFLIGRARQLAAEAEGPPSTRGGVMDVLDRLWDAARSGTIGWLRMSATAVGDDPSPVAAASTPWSLSSVPPAATTDRHDGESTTFSPYASSPVGRRAPLQR